MRAELLLLSDVHGEFPFTIGERPLFGVERSFSASEVVGLILRCDFGLPIPFRLVSVLTVCFPIWFSPLLIPSFGGIAQGIRCNADQQGRQATTSFTRPWLVPQPIVRAAPTTALRAEAWAFQCYIHI